MTDQSKYGAFDAPGKVWVVSAIHGEIRRLGNLHRKLTRRIQPGDKLVYTGNVLGRGPAIIEALDAVLVFRRDFLAIRGHDIGDIALLRGAQEEMWHRLFELQFSVNPADVLEWMLEQGVGATIEAYGGDPQEGMVAARQGAVALNRWSGRLREALRAAGGHQGCMSDLRHAAYTKDGTLLFVSAGIDPSRPLDAQEDTLWWGSRGFNDMAEPYFGCRLVMRGLDTTRGGYAVGDYSATLDGGFGGPAIAACVTPEDGVIEVLEG